MGPEGGQDCRDRDGGGWREGVVAVGGSEAALGGRRWVRRRVVGWREGFVLGEREGECEVQLCEKGGGRVVDGRGCSAAVVRRGLSR